MKKTSALLLCGLILAMDFYLLPLLIKDTGSAMLMLLGAMPLLAVGCAAVYGRRHGFDLRLALLAIALFIPTVFLFYNESAWIYAPVYGAAVAVGNGLGWVCQKRK